MYLELLMVIVPCNLQHDLNNGLGGTLQKPLAGIFLLVCSRYTVYQEGSKMQA